MFKEYFHSKGGSEITESHEENHGIEENNLFDVVPTSSVADFKMKLQEIQKQPGFDVEIAFAVSKTDYKMYLSLKRHNSLPVSRQDIDYAGVIQIGTDGIRVQPFAHIFPEMPPSERPIVLKVFENWIENNNIKLP
jgi:hypothetical protein